MKITEGKIKVLSNDVKNLTQALEGYIKKAFFEGKDICASAGLALKTTRKLQEKLSELESALSLAKGVSEEVKGRAQEAINGAKEVLQSGLELKKRLKEFEAATNVYKKNPTDENKKRVQSALSALKFPEGGKLTLEDYVRNCNPYRKYLERRVGQGAG
ncbi:MAG: hypothetical protein GXO04_05795 [Aquificae bacterium]|nr:hypothetical protein [Aquificota bacterium]